MKYEMINDKIVISLDWEEVNRRFFDETYKDSYLYNSMPGYKEMHSDAFIEEGGKNKIILNSDEISSLMPLTKEEFEAYLFWKEGLFVTEEKLLVKRKK